jgi:RHS repeat-associated protein
VTKVIGSDTRHYYYSDQWQVLEERLNSSSSADRRFVWGKRYVDDLVLRDRGSERFYVLHDYFHPTAVIDTSAAVQERYGYDGFGTPRYMDGSFGSRSSSSYDWETLFGAYRYDLESGLYQVRHRYLHPKLGRWLSRDPIGELGFESSDLDVDQQNHSLYDYARNSPFNLVDPKGTQTLPLPALPLVAVAILLLLFGLTLAQCLANPVCAAALRRLVSACIPTTNASSRVRNCRCTKRFVEEEPPADCPDRVYGTGATRGDCQRAAKARAPEHCRKYYAHCGLIP